MELLKSLTTWLTGDSPATQRTLWTLNTGWGSMNAKLFEIVQERLTVSQLSREESNLELAARHGDSALQRWPDQGPERPRWRGGNQRRSHPELHPRARLPRHAKFFERSAFHGSKIRAKKLDEFKEIVRSSLAL